MAQNGGQDNENNYGKLMYLGYDGGHYVLDLTNKQACGVDFHIKWLSADSTIFVPAHETITIQLPGAAVGNSKIKAKPLYRCGSSGGDMGQLEVITPASLPVTFVSVNAPRISDTEFNVTWEIANPVNIKEYRIQRSKDGVNWETITILWPDQRSKYSIKVNLASWNR